MGGSNARNGISAELLSKKICPTLNLSMVNELVYFDTYLKWLSDNLEGKKIDHVLYSPIISWSDSLVINKIPNIIEIPPISIFSQFKNSIINASSDFNSQGDIKSFNCNSGVLSYNIKVDDFFISNAFVTQEISRRVALIKNITGTDNVYIRIPPVYVESRKTAEKYIKIMNERVEALKGLGLKIVGTTIVSSDSSLFCDAFHANAKGREFFSKEIEFP